MVQISGMFVSVTASDGRGPMSVFQIEFRSDLPTTRNRPRSLTTLWFSTLPPSIQYKLVGSQ
jgi:hypothetical protein